METINRSINKSKANYRSDKKVNSSKLVESQAKQIEGKVQKPFLP